MEVDIDAAGEQLRIFQDQYKETSQEYDRLFEELNKTSEVQKHLNDPGFSLTRESVLSSELRTAALILRL